MLDVGRSAFDVSDLAFTDTRPTYIPDYDTPRFRLTPAHSAYVKIAEGCNHPCSFCVIPQMRGKHRSRKPESVLAEIRALVGEGVREINLISQDTTYYGMDLWEAKAGPRQPVDSTRGPTLVSLLREIQQIEGEFWVRLLYTHPAHWSDELIETIAECDKVARYIDIPLQHIDESMLGRMRRETSRAHIEDLIHKLRAGIPERNAAHYFHRRVPRRNRCGIRDFTGFHPPQPVRTAWDIQILAGRGFPRGPDAGAGPRKDKELTLSSGDGDAAIHCL